MRHPSNLSYVLAVVSVGVACNAVLGLEKLEEQPPGGSGAEAGMGETGGTATGGTATGGRGGSSGSTQGGRGGSGGSSGTAGDGGGGMGGGSGDCEPGDVATCGTVFPSLLGNCRGGEVVCDANGTWGDCSVTPEDADSCDTEGDDANCDGTPNGMCPCINDDTRACGPDTEDGICQRGTQTCVNEMWADCEGAVFPEARDCLSSADNDCDGMADNVRDDECPCAVDGERTCVENAPADWSGPMALATGPGASSPPLCTGTGYERQVLSLFGAVDEGETECDCGCSTPTGMCSQTIGVYRRSTSQQCALVGTATMEAFDLTVTPGNCTGSVSSGYYKPIPPQFTATSTCTVQRTANIEPPAWTRRMVACETNDSSPAGCAAGAECLPELVNPLEGWCIYRTGEHACPSGPFSEQTIYYEDFDDTRSCSACGCGAVSGTCTGSLQFSNGQTNPGSCTRMIFVDSASFGGCVYIDSSDFATGSPTTPQPSASCTPSGGELQGSVAKTGATTVCCKP